MSPDLPGLFLLAWSSVRAWCCWKWGGSQGGLEVSLDSRGLWDVFPQVVQLKAVFPHGAGFVLAFEFMQSDLAEVVRHAQRPLTPAQVKSYLQMLLKGVAFCHANNIVHRVSTNMGFVGLG